MFIKRQSTKSNKVFFPIKIKKKPEQKIHKTFRFPFFFLLLFFRVTFDNASGWPHQIKLSHPLIEWELGKIIIKLGYRVMQHRKMNVKLREEVWFDESTRKESFIKCFKGERMSKAQQKSILQIYEGLRNLEKWTIVFGEGDDTWEFKGGTVKKKRSLSFC